MMFAIGLDIGTTSICGVLVETKTGQTVKSITRENDSFLPTEKPYEKMQDPTRISEQLSAVYGELCENTEEITAIGVTGQMHGIVYLRADGTPTGPLTIWQDGRGDLLYRDGKTYAEYIHEKTGYAVATGYGAVTHFYNTVNGTVPSDAVGFCTIHDLAVMQLTGNQRPKLHASDAASFGLYDLKNGCFDQTAIEMLGMDFSFFPEILPDGVPAGKTVQGIPVSTAIGDNQASVLGSIDRPETTMLVNVGTGAQISCIVPNAVQEEGLDCRPFFDGTFLLAGSSLCGGRSYAILEKLFRTVAETVTGTAVPSAYPAMDAAMKDFSVEKSPIEVCTQFSGTRHQPEKRGSITGINIENLTFENLCAGFMDGMVTELYEMYDAMRPFVKDHPTVIVGSGNGIRNNLPLQKRFGARFSMPVRVPAHREEAAFGAALYGMLCGGICTDYIRLRQKIRYSRL